jgi:circadian clock protein KaiB
MAGEDYLLRLFVAGDEANSRLAEHNLRALCRAHLPERHHIEVVDVLQDVETALAHRVMLAPTLLVIAPRAATLYGTLGDTAKVCAALGLDGAGDGK